MKRKTNISELDFDSQNIVKRIVEYHQLEENYGKPIYLEQVGNPGIVCELLLKINPPISPVSFSNNTIITEATKEKIKQLEQNWNDYISSLNAGPRLNSLHLATAVMGSNDPQDDLGVKKEVSEYVTALKAGDMEQAKRIKDQLTRDISQKATPDSIEGNPVSTVLSQASEAADINDEIDLKNIFKQLDQQVTQQSHDVKIILDYLKENLSEIKVKEIKDNWDKNLVWEIMKLSTIFVIDVIYQLVESIVFPSENSLINRSEIKEGVNDLIKKKALRLLIEFTKKVGKSVLLLTLMDAYFIVVSALIAVITPIVASIASAYAIHKGLDIKSTIKKALNITKNYTEFLLSELGGSALTAIAQDGKKHELKPKHIELLKEVYKHRLRAWMRVVNDIIRNAFNFVKNPWKVINSHLKNSQKRFSLYQEKKQPFYKNHELLNNIMISEAMYFDKVEPPEQLKELGWENFGETFHPTDEAGKTYTVVQAMINRKEKIITLGFKGTDFSNKNDLLNDLFLSKRYLINNLSDRIQNYLGSREDIAKHAEKAQEEVIKLMDEKYKPKGIALSLKYTEKVLKEISDDLRSNKEDIKKYKIVFTGHSLGGGLAQTAFLSSQNNYDKWGGYEKENMSCEVFDAPNLSQRTHKNSHVKDKVKNYILSRTLVSQLNSDDPIGTIYQINKSDISIKFQMFDLFIDKLINSILQRLKYPPEDSEKVSQQLREVLSLPYHKSSIIRDVIANNIKENKDIIQEYSPQIDARG